MRKTDIFLISLLVSALTCACDDADGGKCSDCDRDTEYCVKFGSDVSGEDDTYSCEPLPRTCKAPLECSCLDGQESDSFNLPWCLDEGGCEETDDGLMVICPGG